MSFLLLRFLPAVLRSPLVGLGLVSAVVGGSLGLRGYSRFARFQGW